jgi:hypothetical protein
MTCLILITKWGISGLGLIAAVVVVGVPFLVFPMIRHGNPLWMALGYLAVGAILFVMSLLRRSLWVELLFDLVPKNKTIVGDSVLMLLFHDLAHSFVIGLGISAVIVLTALSFTWLWPAALVYELLAVLSLSVWKSVLVFSLLTGFIAVAAVTLMLGPVRPAASPVFLNGALVGAVIFLPYAWFARVLSKDKALHQRVALLAHGMNLDLIESASEVVSRTVRLRAGAYLSLAIVAAMAVGIWVGHETARQGLYIWAWRSIHWRWP